MFSVFCYKCYLVIDRIRWFSLGFLDTITGNHSGVEPIKSGIRYHDNILVSSHLTRPHEAWDLSIRCRLADWGEMCSVQYSLKHQTRSDQMKRSWAGCEVCSVQGNIHTYMILALVYYDLHEEIERLTQKWLKKLVQPLVQNGPPHFVFVIQGFRAWVGSTRYFWIQVLLK